MSYNIEDQEQQLQLANFKNIQQRYKMYPKKQLQEYLQQYHSSTGLSFFDNFQLFSEPGIRQAFEQLVQEKKIIVLQNARDKQPLFEEDKMKIMYYVGDNNAVKNRECVPEEFSSQNTDQRMKIQQNNTHQITKELQPYTQYAKNIFDQQEQKNRKDDNEDKNKKKENKPQEATAKQALNLTYFKDNNLEEDWIEFEKKHNTTRTKKN